MPTMPQLIVALAPLVGKGQRRVREVATNLAEHRVIAGGRTGRGVSDRSIEDAAALLLGVFGSPSARQSAHHARNLMECEWERGSRVDPNNLVDAAAPAGQLIDLIEQNTFSDVICSLIRNWEVVEDAVSALSRHYEEFGADYVADLFIELFDEPSFGAELAFEVQSKPASGQSAFDHEGRTVLLLIRASWGGAKTVDLEGADFERLSLKASRRFDHRALIALGKCFR